MSLTSKKILTHKKFKEYEKEICKRMDFSADVWNLYKKDIIDNFGFYDSNITYAGRGDSRNFSVSETLVPELYDNFIYYVHDGFYHMEKIDKLYSNKREFHNDLMEEMMEIKANGFTLWPEIYGFFVGVFG